MVPTIVPTNLFGGVRMKKLIVTITVLVFALAACTDSATKTKNFATQAEAQSAIDDNGAAIALAVELALLAVEQTNFDGAFSGDIPLFKNSAGKRLRFNRPLDDTATYNGTTHWWTFQQHEEEAVTDGTQTLDVLLQLRFTPRDAFGLANELTDQMEFKSNVDYVISTTGSDFIIQYDSDLNFSGLMGFRAATGNAIMNGTTNFGFELSSTSQQQSLSFEYNYDIDYNNVTFASDGEYPLSGTVDFVVGLNVTPNVQGIDEYNVAGTITFDGDNTAALVFGGFNFVINLDTGEITAA